MLPKITIVTVVFNCATTIEQTLKSVVEQTYPNIEYVVIDGGSDDGTWNIVCKYSSHIDYLVSEKDSGVYHAMNKAVAVASGDWILFMNSGDVFCSPSVVETVFFGSIYSQKEVIYGGHQVVYRSGRVRVVSPKSRLNFWKGSQFSHQAAFIPLSYHKQYLYDLNYKIAADYAFFCQANRYGIEFKHVFLLIATITAHGMSDTQRIRSVTERARALDSSLFSVLCLPPLIAYMFGVQVAKRILACFVSR